MRALCLFLNLNAAVVDFTNVCLRIPVMHMCIRLDESFGLAEKRSSVIRQRLMHSNVIEH